MRKLLIILVVLLLMPSGFAAVVNGNVYDDGLNLLENVVVEITTFPKQSYVSKDGFYSFRLTDGRYTLAAYFKTSNNTILFTTQEVFAAGGGEFKVDLVLDKVYNGTLPEIPETREFGFYSILRENVWLVVLFFFVIVGLSTWFFFWKHLSGFKSDSLPKELSDVVKLIKANGGRTSQKELRKQLQNISESKISLIISDLESREILQKIKKGRGNIIILKHGKV